MPEPGKADARRSKFVCAGGARELGREYGLNGKKGNSYPSIRDAAKTGLIGDAGEWLDFITARNSSAHDYFSIPETEYVKIAEAFLKKAREEVQTR